MTNQLESPSHCMRYIFSSFIALLPFFISPQNVYAQGESCDNTLQNTLNRVSEMRRVTMEWYNEAIFSIGVRNAGIELQPRSAAANVLSDQAFAIFYSCKDNEGSANGDSDSDRIDTVIDNAQEISEISLPRANHGAFSVGSEILRHTWRRQFEQLTNAFNSTNDWGKAPSAGILPNSGARYQSRIFSNNAVILKNNSNSASREIDSESAAYLEQLEFAADKYDNFTYNEIATRSGDIGIRREERRKKEIEAYQREHERIMRQIEAIGSVSSRQNNSISGTNRQSGSGCPSKSEADAIRARGGTPTCQ